MEVLLGFCNRNYLKHGAYVAPELQRGLLIVTGLGTLETELTFTHKITCPGSKNDFFKKFGATESGRLIQIRTVSSEIGRTPHGAAGLPRKLTRAARM
jgi:hypothetical protein